MSPHTAYGPSCSNFMGSIVAVDEETLISCEAKGVRRRQKRKQRWPVADRSKLFRFGWTPKTANCMRCSKLKIELGDAPSIIFFRHLFIYILYSLIRLTLHLCAEIRLIFGKRTSVDRNNH
jgi:hypothetical protein